SWSTMKVARRGPRLGVRESEQGPSMRSFSAALLAVVLVALCAAGCQRKAAQAPPAEAPVVPVSRPVEREVTDSVEYTGRTDAVESVSIRARVTGYLTRMPFREGA